MSTPAVLQSGEGKRLISNYLAKHVNKMSESKDITKDIDSELIQKRFSMCRCGLLPKVLSPKQG